MEIIKIWNDNASEKQLQLVSRLLREGELIIIPTDTTYAIAGDALNVKAVEKLCNLKGINPDKTNLSIICSDISMASEYAKIGNSSFHLLKEYTPGPFTFLFPAASKLPRAFKGRKIVGVRIPDNKFDIDLAAYMGTPLITTGIAYDSEDYAVNTDLIAENYDGKVTLMVAGEEGSPEVSTVIDCTGPEPEVIREGKGTL